VILPLVGVVERPRLTSGRYQSSGLAGNRVVCTENLIRVDDAMESPKLGNDRAALFRSGRCVYRKLKHRHSGDEVRPG
jgi:hypothetical protein